MTENQKIQAKPRWSLEMYLRKVFKVVIDPIAAGLLKIGVTPNAVTGIGFILTTVSAIFVSQGKFTIGGLILLFAAPLDVVDGSMARLIGPPSPYGSLIDSVTDRYSELVLLGGMLFLLSEYAEFNSDITCIFGCGRLGACFLRESQG